MIEPSNQDFGDTPDSVRDYVQSLEDRIAELECDLENAREQRDFYQRKFVAGLKFQIELEQAKGGE